MPDMIDPQRRRELLGYTYDGRLVLNSEPAEFFDESKVVRGQPGNAGQFASRKGGSTKSADAADESSISGGGGELASQTRKRKNTTKKGLPGVDAGKARELIAQEATWLHDNAGSVEATPERIAAVAEKMKDLPKADLAKIAGSLGIKGLTSKTKAGLGEAIKQKISEKHKVANTVKETPEGKVITLDSGRKILTKKVQGNVSEVEPEDGEDMTDDEWREYTDKLVKHGVAKAKGRHEASKKAYADSKKNGTSDKITSKPPVDAMAGHPFAGMDKKQMQAELERMDMTHNRDSNPWKIQPAGDPAVLNSIMDVVRQAKAKSSFARPGFGEVFDAVKAKHPDLTIKDFHQALFKLQQDKKVRLDSVAQPKKLMDRPAEAMPFDREIKNWLDVGNDGLQAMTNYPVNGEKPVASVSYGSLGNDSGNQDMLVVKDGNGERVLKQAQRKNGNQVEQDVSSLARELGFNVVSATAIPKPDLAAAKAGGWKGRDFGGGWSAMPKIDGRPLAGREINMSGNREALAKDMLLRYATGNTDANIANYLVDKHGKVFSIDYEPAFPGKDDDDDHPFDSYVPGGDRISLNGKTPLDKAAIATLLRASGKLESLARKHGGEHAVKQLRSRLAALGDVMKKAEPTIDDLKELHSAKKNAVKPEPKPSGWHANREPIFAAMRKLDDEVQRHYKTAQDLGPRHGTLSVGSADFDHQLKAGVGEEYLRTLRKGGTPDEALAAASKFGGEMVKKWNTSGSKGRVTISSRAELQRWEGSGQAEAENVHRRFINMLPEDAKGT